MAKNCYVAEGLAKFLDQEMFILSVSGAIGRNKTYWDGIDPESRRGFRESLRYWLHSRVGEYRSERISDERHLANIETLSSTLSERHGYILLDGTFHIGATQKALNLYLKYWRTRGVVLELPHCPIDSIVLAQIAKCASDVGCSICADATWTKIPYTQSTSILSTRQRRGQPKTD